MKCFNTVMLLGMLFGSHRLMAQQEQRVQWTNSCKQLTSNTFEVHFHAAIDEGWHVYSQAQPAGAIGQPVKFSFNSNPLVVFKGKVLEIGKLDKHKDEVLGITQNQYLNEVDFVQVIQLKGSAKTNITGTLTFQACTDERCLFPQTIAFSVALSQPTASKN